MELTSDARSLTFLVEELQRLDALLRAQIQRLQREGRTNELGGLYVSEREFQTLVDTPFGHSPFSPLSESVSNLRPSRWAHLVQTFALTPLEAGVLLLCLLPEIDLRYERIFAYLQDDVTRKRPSIDLVLKLFFPDLPQRLRHRKVFSPNAPLLKYELVMLNPAEAAVPSLLNYSVRVSTRVCDYLLTEDTKPVLPDGLTLDESQPVELDLFDASTQKLLSRVEALSPEALPWLIISGLDRWLSRAAARHVADQLGVSLLCLQPDTIADVDQSGPTLVRQAVREALLQSALLYVDLGHIRGVDLWLDELDALCPRTLPLVIYTADKQWIGQLGSERATCHLRIGQPTFDQRVSLWEMALGEKVSLEEIRAVAGAYRLNGEQIEQAARIARELAWQRGQDMEPLRIDDLANASRLVSRGELGQLARRIEPRHAWCDLVLPQDRLNHLQELCSQYRYRHHVYDMWGFGSKMSRGRGLSALFAGPSGTGKTLAAEVIAEDLNLDLYQIDLSGVVSKYVGETEKNLERIFALARDSNAILLFDEADALFGKRSETKDAHDRYANIEISYLLQKIEAYEGLVILTSNLRQNLDEAFLRRLHFCIEFPFPDTQARAEIWRRTVPRDCPLAEDVDFQWLAEQFRLSGGNIHNALLNAAFLAARENGIIHLRHILQAIRREFQKLGKLVDEERFRPRNRVQLTGHA